MRAQGMLPFAFRKEFHLFKQRPIVEQMARKQYEIFVGTHRAVDVETMEALAKVRVTKAMKAASALVRRVMDERVKFAVKQKRKAGQPPEGVSLSVATGSVLRVALTPPPQPTGDTGQPALAHPRGRAPRGL